MVFVFYQSFQFIAPVCFFSFFNFHPSHHAGSHYSCCLSTVQKMFLWHGLLPPRSLCLRSCLLPNSQVPLRLPRRWVSTCRRRRSTRYRLRDVLAFPAVHQQPRLRAWQRLHDALQSRLPGMSVQLVDRQQFVLLEAYAGVQTSHAAAEWSRVSEWTMESRVCWTQSRFVGAELQILDVGDNDEDQLDIGFHVTTRQCAHHYRAADSFARRTAIWTVEHFDRSTSFEISKNMSMFCASLSYMRQ